MSKTLLFSNRGRVVALLAALLCSVFTPGLFGQSGGSVLTGQVSNVATGAYLEGAAVQLVGTNRTVITDRQGRFVFNNVSPGQVRVAVSYTGLDSQEAVVNVVPGQAAIRNFELTSEVYAMEEFTVAGMREGSALAVTLQRQAPNVKNVVSSDTFGDVADGNIGDFLQRLPGVTGVYVGPDIRAVQIRGVDPGLNSVTMDGQRVASSQSAGVGRQFEFEQASLGNIETLEVTKAATPDMDADSIGGSVNLVTKSAFDRSAARVFRYSIGAVYWGKYGINHQHNRLRAPILKFGPSLSASYSDVVGEKQNIGIFLSTTYHAQPGGETGSLMAYERKADPGPAYIHSVQVPRHAGAPRTRLATGLKLDYKYSDNTVFSFNTFYNWFHENNDTRSMNLNTRIAVATVDQDGNRTGGGYILPDYTDTFTEVLPSSLSRSNITITTNDKSGRTFQFQPSGRHRYPGLDIDYNLTYSNSATYYDTGSSDRHFKSRPRGTVSLALPNIGWTVDRGEDTRWPAITQTAGPDMYDLNNYSRMMLTHPGNRGVDQIYGGRFNLKKEVDLAVPAFVKAGLSYRGQARELWNNNRRYNYVGEDGIFGNAEDQLGQFAETDRYYEDNDTFKGYTPPPWPNPYAVSRHQKDYPELWAEDILYNAEQRLRSRREITETVTAGYAMGSVQINRLSILAGLRVEETRTDAEGPFQYVSPEERDRRKAWAALSPEERAAATAAGLSLSPSEARRRAEEEWGQRIRRKGSYRNVFPGVHFKYEPIDGLVTRASYSTGIGRPSFGQIMPLDTADDVNQRVTIANTGLQPQYANNFDISAEYYFEPVGLFSVGLFLKEIKDFIFTDSGRTVGSGPDNGFNGEYAGYTLVTTANGGSARIRGIEVNYQQQLSFLPGFWQGFGIFGNYTHLQTKGDYGQTGTRSTTEIAGFLPRSANAGINYFRNGWDLRLLMNWRGEYLRNYSGNKALLRYLDQRITWNLKTKYALSKDFAVYMDISNIFATDNTRMYYLYPDRIGETRVETPKVVAGIQGTF